jgi:dihydroorotase-like cyclic amidohydrolase
MIDLEIRDARVVLPTGVVPMRSVLVDDGKIVSIGSASESARRVIDAGERFLLPGFIDTHVHLNFLADAEDAGPDVDEFRSETAAAALSGVTTALIYYREITPYGQKLRDFIANGERSSYVDFGLHLGIIVEEHLEHLEALAAEYGVLSFKMYTTYKTPELKRFGVQGQDDGFILDVLRRVAQIPGAQVHVHCENEEILGRATAVVAENPDGYANPIEAWSAARPPIAEADAVRRVSFLARQAGCRLLIPHVSGVAALDEVREARRWVDRDSLLAETCPQYLLLSAEEPPEGATGKVNPPIRRREDTEELYRALVAGEIDVVGTDHATLRRSGKDGVSIIAARPGFPGMATLVPALMTLSHRHGMPIETIAALTARAARVFSLPAKGLIAPGFDADLMLVDPNQGSVVRADELRSASDFSVFEGRELFGWPSLTVVGGAVVAENRELVADARGGRYLRRGAPRS